MVFPRILKERGDRLPVFLDGRKVEIVLKALFRSIAEYLTENDMSLEAYLGKTQVLPDDE